MEKDTAKRYLNAENATRPFAAIMVENAKLAQLTGPVKIFDLASGTGAVEQEIYNAVPTEKWGDLSILSGDTSEPMLSFLKERSEKEGWTGVETRRVDGGVSRFDCL
jgi:ubiquinone/menaquinone biosynthesis C-methylase UbiE